MDKVIIDNLNSTVKKEDVLYFLGDFCFGGHINTPEWRKKINCETIHFIRGNHDEKIHLYENYFTSLQNKKTIILKGQEIFMNHYPHKEWPNSIEGSLCLFGHVHDGLKDSLYHNSIDVGIDSAYRILGEYRPFSFEEILNEIEKHDKNTTHFRHT